MKKVQTFAIASLRNIMFILGIFLILISTVGYSARDYILATIILIIGIILSYPKGKKILLKIFYKRELLISLSIFRLFIFLFIIFFIIFIFITNFRNAIKYAFYFSLTISIVSYIFSRESIQVKVPRKEVKIPFKDYTRNNEILYAVPKEERKISIIKEKIKKNSSDEKQKEIEDFFRDLFKKKKEISFSEDEGIFLDNANYNLFYGFINECGESLDILFWRIDEKLLSELLWFLRDRDISVRIITKNRRSQGYLKEFKKYCSKLKIELLHRNKIHAKLIIRDRKYLILGSSNITDASLSKSGHLTDCNIITKQKETVEDAINLFESIYQYEDYTKKIKKSKLMYSRNNAKYLPFLLKQIFQQEKEEIILLFSCNQVDKRIIDRIIEWNNKTPISLYVSDEWSTSGLSLDNLKSMEWLYETSINNDKNIKVIPIRADTHTKLYLFKSQNISFISSQNLTVESWQSLLEIGIINDNKDDFNYLYNSIESYSKSNLPKLETEDLEKAEKPESTFSGSVEESRLSVPWDLPEANPKWRIPKTRNIRYYKLVKHKVIKKEAEFLFHKDETPKRSRNLIIDELKKEFLRNQSYTKLYSRPTRQILTGKLSRKQKIKDKIKELLHYQKKYELAKSEEEKRKIKEGIDYTTKELEELERIDKT